MIGRVFGTMVSDLHLLFYLHLLLSFLAHSIRIDPFAPDEILQPEEKAQQQKRDSHEANTGKYDRQEPKERSDDHHADQQNQGQDGRLVA